MPSINEFLDAVTVQPGTKVRLKDYDPSWAGDKKVPRGQRKKFAEELLSEEVAELAEAQERLYASDSWAVLLIFQALDAAGKDGTIKHVMSGVNPQGCQVYSFKHPSHEELDHNFLWRCMKVLPERGRIGIFNRSYYEEVLIVKVHQDIMTGQRIPGAKPSARFWEARYEDINNFENHLARNGTMILKFFLHLSKDEQRRRFLARLDDPAKHWKFSAGDLGERGYWDDYMRTYEEALSSTSTAHAPWFIIPADHKWVSRAMVARIITTRLAQLNLRYPEVDAKKTEQIAAARKQLLSEEGP